VAEVVSNRIAVISTGRAQEAGFPSQAESKTQEVNRNLIFVVLVLALVFVACSLFYVWSHHQIISLGYETSAAAQEERELLQENKKLRLELAELKAPGRIERIAARDLGLVTPQKEQLIIVR
jgi:cell division protein FtsL